MAFPDLMAAADRAALSIVGGSVRYVSGFGTVDLRGVFDSAHVSVDIGTGGVESVGPAVFLRLSDLPAPPEVDPTAQVVVGDVAYRIKARRVDGIGGVRLLLLREE